MLAVSPHVSVNVSVINALCHGCAHVCYLAPYSWPSKCQIQVPNCYMHWCFFGAMFLAVFMPDSGRLSGQCACHILLVAVRIWRTLVFYQVLHRLSVIDRHAVFNGGTFHIRCTPVAGISSFVCEILASMFY